MGYNTWEYFRKCFRGDVILTIPDQKVFEIKKRREFGEHSPGIHGIDETTTHRTSPQSIHNQAKSENIFPFSVRYYKGQPPFSGY